VFDTNRVWCAKLPAITDLFPNARIICCVRDICWIMDSIERLVRKNRFELSGMFGFEADIRSTRGSIGCDERWDCRIPA